MNSSELKYALLKQIPEGSESVTLSTNYGDVELSGELGKQAVEAIRRVMNQQIKCGKNQ